MVLLFLKSDAIDKYYLVEVSIDQDVNEKILGLDEKPLQLIQQLRKVTTRQSNYCRIMS